MHNFAWGFILNSMGRFECRTSATWYSVARVYLDIRSSDIRTSLFLQITFRFRMVAIYFTSLGDEMLPKYLVELLIKGICSYYKVNK